MTLMAKKRSFFIAKVNSLLQEFYFDTLDTFFKFLKKYATSIYNSNTWDIYSKGFEKLSKTFNAHIAI